MGSCPVAPLCKSHLGAGSGFPSCWVSPCHCEGDEDTPETRLLGVWGRSVGCIKPSALPEPHQSTPRSEGRVREGGINFPPPSFCSQRGAKCRRPPDAGVISGRRTRQQFRGAPWEGPAPLQGCRGGGGSVRPGSACRRSADLDGSSFLLQSSVGSAQTRGPAPARQGGPICSAEMSAAPLPSPRPAGLLALVAKPRRAGGGRGGWH